LTPKPNSFGPLSGIRILEIGHYIAAPFCTRILGDLGAEIIKIEPPAGDPARDWGAKQNDRSLWWSVHARNKRSVAIDIKSPEGLEAVQKVIASCDALVENLRPGALARLGLSYEVLETLRPGLVVAHISGYGQNGPERDRAAFGVIGEAIGGLRYLTDHPQGTSDLPPVRVGVSLGDSVAGLYAAIGVLAQLLGRAENKSASCHVVDVALTESVLSLMEDMLPAYGALGQIKKPTGARISTAAPTSAYPTRDGRWLLIAANSDLLFGRLMALIGRDDFASDPELSTNSGRVAQADRLDAAIAEWTRQHDANDAARIVAEADIPSTLIYTAAEIVADPQFQARGMIRKVTDAEQGTVLHPGIVPHLPDCPGAIRFAGQNLGQDTDDVLREFAHMTAQEIGRLRSEKVIT
jgi:crotonobetainyl-CoA:carnitine CoA-transferase CaiB-like acyl-CoA transferase